MPPKKAPAAGASKKTEQKKKEKVIEVSKCIQIILFQTKLNTIYNLFKIG